MILFFRVRPLNPREMKYNDGSVVEFPGNGQILVSFNILFVMTDG